MIDDKEGLGKISLLVITREEEDNIEACISSATGVGEVVVVDSFSSDATASKAESLGATVYTREFTSFSDQKNWGIGRCSGEWILSLDADERLSEPLRAEIAAELSDPSFDGYFLRRRSEFMGRWIRFCGWQRDRVLRLFRSGKGHYPETAVHERLELDGQAGILEGELLHHPYRDLDDHIERLRAYSRRGALELHRRGRSWFPAILLNPPARFLRMYLLQLGFLDGMPGLLLCTLASIQVFFKYAFLREMKRNDGSGG